MGSISAACYARSKPAIDRVLAGETVTLDEDHPERTPAAHLTIHFIPLRSQPGAVDGFLCMAVDVTSFREEAGRLLDMANRDPLTGLLNRAGLQAYLREQHAGLEEGGVALLCIDLDHFKPVNDQYGHLVGDRLLQAFGQRLQNLVRPTDAVARVGGDEFAVVLSGVREPAHAERVARKIVEAAATPFKVEALHLLVGASVGVAMRGGPSESWDELMARADDRLYQAKRSGRGRVHAVPDF